MNNYSDQVRFDRSTNPLLPPIKPNQRSLVEELSFRSVTLPSRRASDHYQTFDHHRGSLNINVQYPSPTSRIHRIEKPQEWTPTKKAQFFERTTPSAKRSTFIKEPQFPEPIKPVDYSKFKAPRVYDVVRQKQQNRDGSRYDEAHVQIDRTKNQSDVSTFKLFYHFLSVLCVLPEK